MQMRFFSSIFLIFTSFLAFSQEKPANSLVKVTMSDEYENTNNNRTFIEKMLRDANGNTIIIKKSYRIFGKNKTIVESFDPKLDLTYSEEMIIEGTGSVELDYVDAYIVDNQPFVFSSYYNKEKDFRYLFASQILKNGKIGKPKKVSEYPTTSSRDGGFDITFSKDSSKLLIVNKIPTKKSESEKFSFIVLDNKFNEVWKAKASLPYENRDVVLSDYAIDNSANVFVLATVDGGREVMQEIFQYQNGASGSKRYKINLRDKIINRLKIMPDASGKIVCVGQYSSASEKDNIFRRNRSSTMGTIFFKIDGDQTEIIEKSTNEFAAKTFDYFEIRSSRVEKGYGIDNLSLFNVWISETGNIFLDFEREYFIYTTDYRNNTSRTTYYSQSGLLVKLSPEGKTLSETIIPKAMTSINDRTGLYHLVLHRGDETYYVYNDSSRNLKEKIESISDVRSAFSPEGSAWVFGDRRPTVVCCKIDAEGKRKFAPLFSFKDDDVFLNTENSLQYDANSFVVIASFLKNFKLVKLDF